VVGDDVEEGASTPGSFASMLKYMSGNASRTWASSGICSPESRWRSLDSSRHVISEIAPTPS